MEKGSNDNDDHDVVEK